MKSDLHAEMLECLMTVWRKFPDWRFGQMIASLYGLVDIDHWKVTDEEALDVVQEFANKDRDSSDLPDYAAEMEVLIASIWDNYPDWSLHCLLVHLANDANASLWDVADADLLRSARSHRDVRMGHTPAEAAHAQLLAG